MEPFAESGYTAEIRSSAMTEGQLSEVELPLLQGNHRLLNVHRNVPGVLRDINRIVADMGANVRAQVLNTRDEIGYLIMDVGPKLSRRVKRDIEALETNIKTRLLF